ncbi:hypothetical protein ACFL4L_06335 [bacterium]
MKKLKVNEPLKIALNDSTVHEGNFIKLKLISIDSTLYHETISTYFENEFLPLFSDTVIIALNSNQKLRGKLCEFNHEQITFRRFYRDEIHMIDLKNIHEMNFLNTILTHAELSERVQQLMEVIPHYSEIEIRVGNEIKKLSLNQISQIEKRWSLKKMIITGLFMDLVILCAGISIFVAGGGFGMDSMSIEF